MKRYKNRSMKRPKRRKAMEVEHQNEQMKEAMQQKFPWTTDQIAEELGMSIDAFRVWKQRMEKEGKATKPKTGSLLCIVDPDQKNRLRYSDTYLDKLREVRGAQPRFKQRERSFGQAKMKLTVPVYDETISKFLLRKYKDQKGLENYLRDHLIEISKPVLKQMDDLRREFDEKMAQLLGSM